MSFDPNAPFEVEKSEFDPTQPFEAHEPSVGEDVAKSAGIGLAKGPIQAAGLAGDVGALAKHAIGDYNPFDWLSGKVKEMYPEYVAANVARAKKYGARGDIAAGETPTSAEIQDVVERGTGKFYEPQTEPGKYAEAIGSTVANPLSYVGPGGVPAKVAAATATGAGSEAGRQVAEAAGLPEPVGQIAGGILGGSTVGKISAGAANVMRARKIPTTEQLADRSNAIYDQARSLDVGYDPNKTIDLAQRITSQLMKEGHRGGPDGLSKGTFSIVGEITPQTGMYKNFSDIESTRSALGQVSQEIHPTTGKPTADARAARVAIKHIDDFLENPTNALPGDEAKASLTALLSEEARGNWQAMKRSQQIEQSLMKGEVSAGVSGTGSNVDNALRQQIAQIIKNPRRFKNFSPDQQEMLRDIALGNPVRNSSRLLGKLAATGIVSAGGVAYLGHLMGLGKLGAFALPLAGEGFRRTSEQMTKNRYGRLLQSIREDSPMGRQVNLPPRASAYPFIGRAAATSIPSTEPQP